MSPPPNKSVNRSGYIPGDSTVKLLELLFGDLERYLMVRRPVTSNVRRPETFFVKQKVGDYSKFVEHPRYGRGPRFTDVCPREVPLGYRLTTYISDSTIGGTAVEADLERQTFSPVPVLYYFDLKRICFDCGRPFIFFAEEQKYWYESLGFVLDASEQRS